MFFFEIFVISILIFFQSIFGIGLLLFGTPTFLLLGHNFLEVLKSSKHRYFRESEINFFELVIDLLQDESLLYIDLIDVITYLQHFEKLASSIELKRLIKDTRD